MKLEWINESPDVVLGRVSRTCGFCFRIRRHEPGEGFDIFEVSLHVGWGDPSFTYSTEFRGQGAARATCHLIPNPLMAESKLSYRRRLEEFLRDEWD